MATESKPKAEEKKAPSPAERELANLQLIEKRLKDKIANRIPKFTEIHPGSRDAALERAQQQLESVQAAIKAFPKTS